MTSRSRRWVRDAVAGALLSADVALRPHKNPDEAIVPPCEAPADAWTEDEAKRADAVVAFLNAHLGAFRSHGWKMLGDGPTERITYEHGKEIHTPVSDADLAAKPMGQHPK